MDSMNIKNMQQCNKKNKILIIKIKILNAIVELETLQLIVGEDCQPRRCPSWLWHALGGE